MSHGPSPVRAVSWHEILPWLLLFRVFRVATSLRVLILASAGALLTSAGWQIAARVFPDVKIERQIGLTTSSETWSQFPHERLPASPWTDTDDERDWWKLLRQAPSNPVTAVATLVSPWLQALRARPASRSQLYCLVGGLWTLFVWSYFGAAIGRIASIQLGREERPRFGKSLRYAARRVPSTLGGPLLPLAGVFGLAMPIAFLGLLMRADWGVLVAGILWLFVTIAALMMMILALGLLFGWPLMWGTISTEGSDAFDAISRSFAYTFQCPLQYMWYATVSTVLGLLGWLLVWGVSEAIVYWGLWGVSWGMSPSRLASLVDGLGMAAMWPTTVDTTLASNHNSGSWQAGVTLIALVVGLVRTIASGYAYSYLWCASSGIYLLLRRDCDHCPLSDVYVEDAENVYELPTADSLEIPTDSTT